MKQCYSRKAVALLVIFMLFAVCFQGDVVSASSKVSLSKTKVSLYKGAISTLKVKGTSANVKWSTSNKKVATVSSKGKVTAKKKGKATITAKVGSKKLKCLVTVKNPTLSKSSISLYKGKSYTLKVKGSTAKSWSSSNKSIATVSKGKVIAKKVGTTYINCVTKSGINLKCKVSVKNTPAIKVSATPTPKTGVSGISTSATPTEIPATPTISVIDVNINVKTDIGVFKDTDSDTYSVVCKSDNIVIIPVPITDELHRLLYYKVSKGSATVSYILNDKNNIISAKVSPKNGCSSISLVAVFDELTPTPTNTPIPTPTNTPTPKPTNTPTPKPTNTPTPKPTNTPTPAEMPSMVDLHFYFVDFETGEPVVVDYMTLKGTYYPMTIDTSHFVYTFYRQNRTLEFNVYANGYYNETISYTIDPSQLSNSKTFSLRKL